MVRQADAVPRRLSLIALAVAAALAAPACWAQKHPDDAYRTDDRLQAAVTLSLRDRPFSEVTKALGDATGVTMRAGKSVADDKACVFVKDLAAQDLMAQIADHFGCRWRFGDGGYVLELTSAEANLEALAHARVRDRAIAALDAEIRAMQRLTGCTDEQLNARIQEIADQLAAPGLAPDAAAALRTERMMAARARDPSARAGAAIFSMLDSRQLAQLRSGAEVRVAALPPDLALGVAAAMNPHRPGAPAAAPEQPDAASARVSLASSDETGVGSGQADRLPARQIDLRVAYSAKWPHRSGSNGWSIAAPLVDTAIKPNPSTSDDPRMTQQISIRLGRSAAARQLFGQPIAPSLGALLEQIHTETGINVLADSFVRARVAPAMLEGKTTALAALNAVCKKLNYTWEQDEKGVRVRSNRYYDDRPAEVPERALKPLRDKAAAGEALALDDYAALAAELTDIQIRSLDSYWENYLFGTDVPRPVGSYGLYNHRADLRFWKLLDPRQRALALSQDGLPASRLRGPQLAAFGAAIACPESGMFGMAPPPDNEAPRALASGIFMLKNSDGATFTSPPDASGAYATTFAFNPPLRSDPQGKAAPRTDGLRVSGPDGTMLSVDALQRHPADQHAFLYFVAGSEEPVRSGILLLVRTGRTKGILD